MALVLSAVAVALIVVAAATWMVLGPQNLASADTTTPLSQGKPATASSLEGGQYPASAAVDGDTGTRWSSSFSDPQWLEVDLGVDATISRVVLNWERAYARAYQIQVSTDGVTWSTISATTTGTGGTQTLNVTSQGRYVRMYGTARSTGYGYSLWEFQVFGSATGSTPSPSTAGFDPSASATPSAAPTGVPTTAPSGPTVLISQDKTVAASSMQDTRSTPAAAVTDGDLTSRWSSTASDPQWIQIDLGASATISKVVLYWEGAYAKAFQIQVSADAVTWTSIYSTTTGTGGTQTMAVTGSGRYIRMYGTARATGYGYSLYEFQVYGVLPPASTVGYVLADPQVTGVTPAQGNPPARGFHEFQANCAANHDAPDDPIVFFGQPGKSHMHTFMGNTTTNANTTLASLQAGATTCKAPGDKSGYWMPTMYNGNTVVDPIGPQVIYYKSGVIDYTSVRPFPAGLRFVVGSPMATEAQFTADPGLQEGWECGDSFYNYDFPATCAAGSQLNIRFQSPSCWNGLYLDTPTHKGHMAYPINGRCPADFPIALPMIEFKMAFPVSGDMSQVRLASGRGYSFHYDFYNAWDPATLAALVTHCVNGGLQCDARGFDQTNPGAGSALNSQYVLP
jgi:hypothetical protein